MYAPAIALREDDVPDAAATGAVAADRAALEQEALALRARLPAYPTSYLYVLMAVSAVDSADRTILSTVFEDVKRTFDVGDGQLGLLVAAYSVVATISALPFGFAADRWNRVRLIAFGFLPWSLAMFWTGAATSFGMMFAARMFLGTIEATNGPSTPSLIGDYYPVARRSRLYGIYNIGALVGSLLGFAVAGTLASVFSWRLTFVAWGGMGLVCAAVVLRVLREPVRGLPDALHRLETKLEKASEQTVDSAPGTEPPADPPVSGTWDYRRMSPGHAVRELLKVRTMWILFVASSIGEFLMSGLATWAVTFFRRYHGLSAAGAGGVTALLGLGTVVGVLIGGRMGDRMLLRGRPERRIWLAATSSIAAVATLVPAFAADSLPVAVPFFLATGFFIGVPMPVRDAVGLDILVPHLRGRAMAIRSVLRVVMTALAPLAFGILSDRYGLRQAILFSSPAMLIGGLITLTAMTRYPRDMAYAQGEALRQYELEDRDRRTSGDAL